MNELIETGRYAAIVQGGEDAGPGRGGQHMTAEKDVDGWAPRLKHAWHTRGILTGPRVRRETRVGKNRVGEQEADTPGSRLAGRAWSLGSLPHPLHRALAGGFEA